MGRQQLELDCVTRILKPLAYTLPRAAFIMAEKIRHVLNQEKARLVTLQNPNNVLKQIAPLRAVEAKLLARLGEWLTWKACAQNVVDRNPPIRSAYVVEWLDAKIFLVERGQI
jgi:hypothetical protein